MKIKNGGYLDPGEIKEKLSKVAIWLSEQGVPVSDNRFAEIWKNMRDIYDYKSQGKLFELLPNLGQKGIITSINEAMPFIDIYEAFHARRPHEKIPKETLKRIVRGSFFAEDEDRVTNESRNHLFELELAAILSGRGIPIISFDDISFKFENSICNIQCKRPMTIGSINSVIGDAVKQIQAKANRIDPSKRATGIIALAVDKILGADKQVFVEPNLHVLEQRLEQILRDFKNENSSKWMTIPDTRLIAVFVYFKYLAAASPPPDLNRLTMGGCGFIDPLATQHIVESSDARIIKRLIEAFAF